MLPNTFVLKSGLSMPGIGLGTWRMGETPGRAAEETAAIRRAIERGIVHIDTAEMYGEGASEQLIGRAIAGIPRDRLFLVSKVYPWNARRCGMVRACEATLARLGTEYLDLYLLHWPGRIAFQSTLEGAAALKEAGKIRAFGVSNVDTALLSTYARAGLDETIEVNQVMYNPARRGIELDLLPLMAERATAAVAYTPLEPERLGAHPGFAALAAELGLTPAQLAVAWHVTRGRAVPIPKAASLAHVDALAEAVERRLDAETLAAIDAMLPPPTTPQPLDIL